MQKYLAQCYVLSLCSCVVEIWFSLVNVAACGVEQETAEGIYQDQLS